MGGHLFCQTCRPQIQNNRCLNCHTAMAGRAIGMEQYLRGEGVQVPDAAAQQEDVADNSMAVPQVAINQVQQEVVDLADDDDIEIELVTLE